MGCPDISLVYRFGRVDFNPRSLVMSIVKDLLHNPREGACLISDGALIL